MRCCSEPPNIEALSPFMNCCRSSGPNSSLPGVRFTERNIAAPIAPVRSMGGTLSSVRR